MREYKNRYGDVFTFTEDDDHNILWEGNFEFCRIGMPNDYQNAYNAYLKDNEGKQSLMTLAQFKDVVHHYDDETLTYDYPKYIKMVSCLRNEIDMVDPSGGPYLSRGMSMESFGFKGSIIEDFKPTDKGFKLIIKKNNMRSYRELEALVIAWAAQKGILENGTPRAQAMKTWEETDELITAIENDNREEVIDALGDILVTIIIQAEMQGLKLTECLDSAYNIISQRTGKMVDGQFVKDGK
jgi:NTP pyrophosphatase (non-canonical NTP hydrolase)